MRTSNVIMGLGAAAATAGAAVRATGADAPEVAGVGTGDVLLAGGAALALAGAAMTAHRGWVRAYDVKLGMRELSPFEIRRGDVRAYLRGSAVPDVQFHGGKAAKMARMRANGAGEVLPSGGFAGKGGAHGSGFYTARHSNQTTAFGAETNAVAVRADRVLRARSSAAFWDEMAARGIVGRDPDAVRRTLLDAGYDAARVPAPNGAADHVVFNASGVRFVVADQRPDLLGDAVGAARRAIARTAVGMLVRA